MDVYLDAHPIERSKLTVIHHQFGFTSTLMSLNCPFGRPRTVDLDASKYTNTYRPFGRNLAVQMDALTPFIWTIQIHLRRPSIWTTLERIIGCFKYTLNERPNGRSGEVQLDSSNIRSLTVQMDFLPCGKKLIVGSWQTILLFIVCELAGGGSVAVAVGVSDM